MKRRNFRGWLPSLIVMLLAGQGLSAAITTPLQIVQDQALINQQSLRGLPLTSAVDRNIGSDGRGPTANDTYKQFQSFWSFGALAVPATPGNLSAGKSLFANAAAIGLPVGTPPKSKIPTIYLLRATVGSPVLVEKFDLLMGAIITPPPTTETGSAFPAGETSDTYWVREPYTTNSHASDPFYWSPNAGQVFASQPGPVNITWRKVKGSPTAPATPTGVSYIQEGSLYFTLYTVPHLVSSSAVKPVVNIFWNQKVMQSVGATVAVPRGTIAGINVIPNPNFPLTVDEEYTPPGYAPVTAGTTNAALPELRTLWFDYQGSSISAYNLEGRVFVEFYGDLQTDGVTHKFLGFEIVDVHQKAYPNILSLELGERVRAYDKGDDQGHVAQPILTAAVQFKDYSFHGNYYATRPTDYPTEIQYYWLKTSLLGIQWPDFLNAYNQAWPTDASHYSHYVRPLVGSSDEASQSAVPLPTGQSPVLAYQDPLDQTRGFVTPDSKYYTWLTSDVPMHRGLLQFTVKDTIYYERVFSWLDTALATNRFATNSAAATLTAYNKATLALTFTNITAGPRVVRETVNVGDRLIAPMAEEAAFDGTNYLAGHIHLPSGDSFNPDAYLDPLVVGVDVAARGSIIPVNAVPGKNLLEVWWFRSDAPPLAQGFDRIYWPSVVGFYTLQFNPLAPTIVLSDNSGTGPLLGTAAGASVYFQNDRAAAGFNPNEEHALVQGGAAYALRDDLNVTNGVSFTSLPYVLLSYVGTDGRPSMLTYKVIREDILSNKTFDYEVVVGENGGLGKVLQPPMPLPLLGTPLNTNGDSFNHEVQANIFKNIASSSNLTSSFKIGTKTISASQLYMTLSFDKIPPFSRYRDYLLGNYNSSGAARQVFLFALSSDPVTNSLTCMVSPRPSIAVTAWQGLQPTPTNLWRFQAELGLSLPTNSSVVVLNRDTGTNYLALVNSYTTNSGVGLVELNFGVKVLEDMKGADFMVQSYTNASPLDNETWKLYRTSPRPTLSLYSTTGTNFGKLAWTKGDPYQPIDANSFTYQDRNGSIWVYRGPHDTKDRPALSMRYYYATQPGFFFPKASDNVTDLGVTNQPPQGTITPYLRPWSQARRAFLGDPINGSQNGNSGDDNALGISYYPKWSPSIPTLKLGASLTTAARGLPAVRGNTSVRLLYQQSTIRKVGETLSEPIAPSALNPSVVLHDPTRAKTFALGSSADGLSKLPNSVNTSSYNGKLFFPSLPPHLADRFYFDSTVGAKGSLMFIGKFIEPAAGSSYLLLNVLSSNDQNYLIGLCDPNDPDQSKWRDAILGLSTKMIPFVKDPTSRGRYIKDTNTLDTVTYGPADLCEALYQDVPVDSYAMSAVGPGTGYVVMAFQDGEAFTKASNPVTVQMFRVVNELDAGSIAIVPSGNPLSQFSTFQQVNDLAGRASLYDFDWRIAAPIDGAPPAIWTQTASTLIQGGSSWHQVVEPSTSDLPGSLMDLFTTAPNRIFANLAQKSFYRWFYKVGYQSSVAASSQLTVSISPPALVMPFGRGDRIRLTLPWPNIPAVEASVLSVDVQTRTLVLQLPNFVQTIDAKPFTIYLPGTKLFWDTVSNPAYAGYLSVAQAPSADYKAAISSTNAAQAILLRTIQVNPTTTLYSDLYVTLDVDASTPVTVYLDGSPIAQVGRTRGNSAPVPLPPDLNSGLSGAGLQTFQVDPTLLNAGEPDANGNITHTISAYVSAQGPVQYGSKYKFDLALTGHQLGDLVTVAGSKWLQLDSQRYPDGLRATLGGAANIQVLSDNWLTMRYKFKNSTSWSRWTPAQLGEGWIKRVLAGVNPFSQRVTDLMNNTVNEQVSMLTQAGARWEGNVALNMDTLNHTGLIQIYETVLNLGRSLSIDAGINYGPANDALMLAAGYLSDLYSILGNEAWGDANNPTISVGTDSSFGNLATSLFTFSGQMANLLEQQEAMLRGRDDVAVPGVETAPVYNRLYWNYTRGINAGEVIYALNYDIKPSPANGTGVVGASDAAYMFPQGHGDAYGHYLTAVFNYYRLLMNPKFSWVPKAEAVTVLGVPVAVNYMHERKFAQGAAQLANVGKLTYELAWREAYIPFVTNGWGHLSPTRVNTNRLVAVTRYWGPDHWASRVAQGSFVNWVVGNSLLPAVDPNPGHQGIQKVDRTTVVELSQLPDIASALQTDADNAEAFLNPLGMPESAVAFDINPNLVTGTSPQTHFEQVYSRATVALENAVTAFNDAQTVTRELRKQTESLDDLVASAAKQEMAYTNKLISIYGRPYSDDVGPGATYAQGYEGPDLLHYLYVNNTDLPDSAFNLMGDPFSQDSTFYLDIQTLPTNSNLLKFSVFANNRWNPVVLPSDMSGLANSDGSDYDRSNPATPGQFSPTYATNKMASIAYTITARGFSSKPADWTGSRPASGRIQQAIIEYQQSWLDLRQALDDAHGAKEDIARSIALLETHQDIITKIQQKKFDIKGLQNTLAAMNGTTEAIGVFTEMASNAAQDIATAIWQSIPQSIILGLAAGGDTLAPARGAAEAAGFATKTTLEQVEVVAKLAKTAMEFATAVSENELNYQIDVLSDRWELAQSIQEIVHAIEDMADHAYRLTRLAKAVDEKNAAVQTVINEGLQVLNERQAFRARQAAIIQGMRVKDAAFRLFKNEKLERYNTMFDLAARYSMLAANAYDYETGLLNSTKGKKYLQQIVRSRALGMLDSKGTPMFAGSANGDPGLSSALAAMKADWDSLRGRLGFHNPDAYGTVFSLRSENFRILPDSSGDSNWKDLLARSRVANLLADSDVRRNCLGLDDGTGLPVPGVVITFSTSIASGYNFFGKTLAPGDHNFTASSFATKIYAVGVALEGYVGMDSPASAGSTTAGGTPTISNLTFTDPKGLAATPYVYLIPVGDDSMRTPPLGDTPTIRTWTVNDIAVPMPFNIGGSDYSNKPLWQSLDSLSEPLFTIRKHQAFRPVPAASFFSTALYSSGGSLQRSQFTNTRLVGRSAWNSRWKLVIPGATLLNDPNQGLDRLINSLTDVKLHLVTFSNSGN